jgi:hypothetical protein
MATLTNDAHAAHAANDAQAADAATDAADAAIRSTNGTMVMLETPYSGNLDRNLRYLMLCGFDAYARGEMPVATHAFMTTHPAARHYYVSNYAREWDVYSREQAIVRGQVLRRRCDLTVMYDDLGMSTGMPCTTANNTACRTRCAISTSTSSSPSRPRSSPASSSRPVWKAPTTRSCCASRMPRSCERLNGYRQMLARIARASYVCCWRENAGAW